MEDKENKKYEKKIFDKLQIDTNKKLGNKIMHKVKIK